MNFRENVRDLLEYNSMEQKELAYRAGISLHSLETYLRKDSSMPSADKAVRIAKALGVTVEYLVDGDNSSQDKDSLSINPALRQLSLSLEKLSEGDRKVVYDTARHLAESLQKKRGTV
jgi:transcriptional regulator with XRE-family HTH domain